MKSLAIEMAKSLFDCVLCFFLHNHPSGDPEPSEDDKKLTKRLVEAGELIGIAVLDHIIYCNNTYLSMKVSNML